MEPLPFELIEAMIQCFGKSFHYKDTMAAFLLQAGVNKNLVEKYRAEMKFPWARKVLTELATTEQGCLLQRRILTELCKLTNLPDPGVEDRNTGLEALRNLKRIAAEKEFLLKQTKADDSSKRRIAEARAKLLQERTEKLQKLREQFNASICSPNRQMVGLSLEDLLADLFGLFEIEYRKSYRTETQQIDGAFKLDGFDYLVEAKWRKDQPTEGEIGGFKHKVSDRLESTRGLYVSISGFRPEVIEKFNGHGAKIIFMDGEHLTHILEGRIDLKDALRKMIETAAQKGIVFTKFF